MKKGARVFSLIELLVVMVIILILLGMYRVIFDTDRLGVTTTKADIINIELAMIEYRTQFGTYPFANRGDAVNLSDDSDAEVKAVIVKLLKIKSFNIDEQGVPVDHWGNPIYFIDKRTYSDSPLAASVPNISEKVYYNPNSFQLVSGGPDGTPSSLGVAEDNVANYPKQ